jgi:hypothetical protein
MQTVCDTTLSRAQNADSNINLFAWLTVHNAVKLYGKGVGDLVASTWRGIGVPLISCIKGYGLAFFLLFFSFSGKMKCPPNLGI